MRGGPFVIPGAPTVTLTTVGLADEAHSDTDRELRVVAYAVQFAGEHPDIRDQASTASPASAACAALAPGAAGTPSRDDR